MFEAYFVDGLNIGLPEILKDIAVDAKMNTKEFDAYLESEQGIGEVNSDTKFAYTNGITGVPYFIFNKQFSITGAQEPTAFLPLLDIKPELDQ